MSWSLQPLIDLLTGKNGKGGVQIADENGSAFNINNPVPTPNGSAYYSDLDVPYCTVEGWTIDGSSDKDLVLKSLLSGIQISTHNDTATNPKVIDLQFQRPVKTRFFGVNAPTGERIKNTKIELIRMDGVVSTVDNSADGTDKEIELGSTNFDLINRIRFSFYTDDAVQVGFLGIFKAQEVQAEIQGTDASGTPHTAGMSKQGNLKVILNEYGDTPSIDAFDRLRVSNPHTLFDSKQLHDKQPLFWDEKVGGSATSVHDPVNAETKMSVTASASDYVIRQTKQRFNYQPGKSQLILMTFHSPQMTGVTSRIGLFDDTGVGNNLVPNNGIFFECDGALSWNIAKNGAIAETVAQSSWNVDKLDGTGDSGITLDMEDSQIMIIDYEWLGVGRVRAGFVIDGIIRYCHYFNHANNGHSSVYMSTPNLPLRYSIETDGTNPNHLDHICSSVMSEGGIEETGVLRSVDTGTTHIDADAADVTYAVVGIKLKEAYKDITVVPEFFNMINEAGDDFRWSLCLNPTIASTFVYGDVTNSAMQKAAGVTANTVSDEGIVIDSGYVISGFNAGGADSRKFVTSLKMGSLIDGTLDELVLCVTPLTAGADVQASLTFRELL